MNLHALLSARADNPIRVGLIGGGKFGAMFLAQARRTPGLHVAAIADLNLPRAREQLARLGWPESVSGARDLEDALSRRTVWLTEDSGKLIADPRIEVLIEIGRAHV